MCACSCLQQCPPPGLAGIVAESATFSRERRRIALAAREVSAAATEKIMTRLDEVTAKLDAIIAHCDVYVTLTSGAEEMSVMKTGLDRMETISAVSPVLEPSLDEVLNEVMARKVRQSKGVSKGLHEPEQEASPQKHAEFDIWESDDDSIESDISLSDAVANVQSSKLAQVIDVRGDWRSLPTFEWEVLHSKFLQKDTAKGVDADVLQVVKEVESTHQYGYSLLADKYVGRTVQLSPDKVAGSCNPTSVVVIHAGRTKTGVVVKGDRMTVTGISDDLAFVNFTDEEGALICQGKIKAAQLEDATVIEGHDCKFCSESSRKAAFFRCPVLDRS